VSVVERLGRLSSQLGDLARARPAAILFETLAHDVGQIAAVDQPHREIGHSAFGTIGVHRNDIRVLERRRGLGLDLEAP
jgi:hypothetical protein